jgi:transcriptional regulator with XRE-family HTH domain
MDETEADGIMTVGQRLREAREAQGLSIEDIAASTRIPTRHLSSLETSEWDKLPAATYSIGFAKNYAGAVGLDRAQIAEQLREEMGGSARVQTIYPEVHETVDPARTMPRGLVFGALGLLLLVLVGLTWMSNRSLEGDEAAPLPDANAAAETNLASPVPAPTPAAGGPVVLTATDPVWIQIKDNGAVLKQGELAAGESYQLPPNAVAPKLTTGKPEAIRITVGAATAPAVGPAGQTATNVSLLGPDLMRGPATAPAAATTPTPSLQPAPAQRTARSGTAKPTTPAAPQPPPVQTPSDTNTAAPAQ